MSGVPFLAQREPLVTAYPGFRLIAGGAPERFLAACEALRSDSSEPLLLSAARSAEQESGFLPALQVPPAGARIGFLTSGSTGVPRAVWKHDSCLAAETEAHAAFFAELPDGPVLALVPPWHVYGYLFTVLLPKRLGRACVYSEPGVPPAHLPRAALVVAVPALFPYVEELADAGRVAGSVVFSAAPLGKERRTRWHERDSRGARAFEILGSTETGGIGISEVDGPRASYAPLPGVALRAEGGVTYLRSRYLAPASAEAPLASLPEEPLDDLLTLASNGHFSHEGRRDRIFKFSGRRHSLAEIEARLMALLPGAQVRCFFAEDPVHPKGGALHAFIASAPESSLGAVRAAWRERGELPFPQQIHFCSEFPRDGLGKITLHSLLTQR